MEDVPSMTEQDILKLVETVTECTPGVTKLETPLTQVSGWDSLAVIGLISAIHRDHGIRVPVAKLSECKNPADLLALVNSTAA